MADEDLHQRLIDTASIVLAVVEEVRVVQIALVVQEESLGALNIEVASHFLRVTDMSKEQSYE